MKSAVLAVLTALLIFVFATGAVPLGGPSISITSPTYDQLGEGRTYEISWSASDVDTVSLVATGHRTSIPERNRGDFRIIIAKKVPASTGSASWKVPFLDTLTFRITAKGYDSAGKLVAEGYRPYTFRPSLLANRTADGIYIDVRQEIRQRLYVMKNNKVIHVYLTSGSKLNEYYPRNVHPNKPHDHYGVFRITNKYPVWHSKLFDVDMTWAMRYWNGHFIHGTSPSEYGKLGHAASSGCNRLERSQAKELYDSTPIGTRVEIVVK